MTLLCDWFMCIWIKNHNKQDLCGNVFDCGRVVLGCRYSIWEQTATQPRAVHVTKTKQTTLVMLSSSPEAKRMMELRIFQVKIKPGQKYLLYFFVRVYLFYGMDWPILVAWLFSGPNVIPDNYLLSRAPFLRTLHKEKMNPKCVAKITKVAHKSSKFVTKEMLKSPCPRLGPPSKSRMRQLTTVDGPKVSETPSGKKTWH